MTAAAHLFAGAVPVVLALLVAAAVLVRVALPLAERHEAYEDRAKTHRAAS